MLTSRRLQALHPEHDFRSMFAMMATMLLCAFLPPKPRVLAFSCGVVGLVALHWRELWSTHLAVQLVSYATGAAAFLR